MKKFVLFLLFAPGVMCAMDDLSSELEKKLNITEKRACEADRKKIICEIRDEYPNILALTKGNLNERIEQLKAYEKRVKNFRRRVGGLPSGSQFNCQKMELDSLIKKVKSKIRKESACQARHQPSK